MHGAHWESIPGTDHFDIQSPYGYGGPISSCDAEEFRADAWHAYQSWCQEHGAIVEFVRLHPLAPWQSYPGTVVSERETVVVNLQHDCLRDQYATRCRTAIRKAEKAGVVVQEYPRDLILSNFSTFYREGMERIGASSFYLFSDRYFKRLAAMQEIRLFVCESEGEWISAGLFFKGADCLEYHLSATTQQGRLLSATNLLIDGAAEFGKRMGCQWLYLGGGTDGSEDNPLLKFKAGFSDNRALFSYGYAVHDSTIYSGLRKWFPSSNRVLFYR